MRCGKDLLQELGPCSAIRRASRRTVARFGLKRGELNLARESGRGITRWRVKDRPIWGDGRERRGSGADSAATASVGGNEAMVAREIDARRWDERGQRAEELEG